ncbi:unnamed protein product [Mucor hiemalis]
MNNTSPISPKSIEFFQKPHTLDDTPIYEKPNAYDEEPPVVITASRHGSRSSKMTMDSFASRYFQRKIDVAKVVVADMVTPENVTNGECYSPNTPIKSPPLSPNSTKKGRTVYNSQLDYHHITSYILSQSTPTTQMSFGHHHEDDNCSTLPSYYVLPSSPANSITALLSNDSGIISSFFLLPNKRLPTTANTLVNNNSFSNNTIVYSFKKASILKPHQHHIYLHVDHQEEDDEEIMVYRKIQPYSYTWGLQSMLYSNRNDGQGIKVAEARRKAFQKEIFIEAADYDNSEVNDITQSHINNIKSFPATNNIHCQNLIKKSQSNILFEYEIWFHGSRLRWRRPSLLSNDFTCEVKLTREETKLLLQEQHRKAATVNGKKSKSKSKKTKSTVSGYTTRTEDNEFIDSDSDNDEDDHDNHTHKTCRRWKLLAEFHSHNLSYLNKDLGKLSIDLDILNQVERERCDLLEANIIMTCSTLIDLIRDVMGKP